MDPQGDYPWDPRVGAHGIPGRALGDPWALGTLGPWEPLGRGDPWALRAGALP